MRNKRIAGGAAVAAIALATLTACGGHGSTSTDTGARASSFATSSAAARAKEDLTNISKNCGTATAAGQILAAKEVLSKDGRDKLMAKCGIPQDQRKALEVQLLSAAEKAHLTTHDGRVSYFEVTMPKLILAAQTAASMGASTPKPTAS